MYVRQHSHNSSVSSAQPRPCMLLLLLLLHLTTRAPFLAQAVRSVSGQVLADAGALVYGSWCPQAAAKFNNLETLVTDSLQNITKRVAERCTQKDGNGHTRKGIADLATSSAKPLVKKLAEALTEAKSCGCQKVAACTWCKPGQAVGTPQELAAQLTQAGASTSEVKRGMFPLSLAGLSGR